MNGYMPSVVYPLPSTVMIIKYLDFLGSFPTYRQCPSDTRPEYAFIGRSNVGKSSLVNMLCGYKKAAKVSGTPGKTQFINMFLINNEWLLADLPGYGYARVSKTKRRQFEQMIRDYMNFRDTLACVFVLIDIRHKPQEIDVEFVNQLGKMRIPFVLVFTKADKNKKTPELNVENVEAFKAALLETWEEVPPCFITSAESGLGREELHKFIDDINKDWAGQE